MLQIKKYNYKNQDASSDLPHKDHHHHHHHNSNSIITSNKWLLHFVYSNAYLVVPIVAITAQTYLLLGNFEFNLFYLGFVGFSTLFLYPLHRLIGIKKTPWFEHTKPQVDVNTHPTFTRISVAIGGIGTLLFASQLPITILLLLIPLGAISMGYSVPVIPTKNGWKRLRDVPGIKIYAITIVVTLITSTIPLLGAKNVDYLDIILLGLQRFVLILAITIPFDVRDAYLDKRWGLKTIPLIMGNKRAIKLAVFLMHFTTLLAFAQYFYTQLFGLEIVLATFIAEMFVVLILRNFEKNNSYLYNAFMVEGAMVYHFAIIAIAIITRSLFI